MAKVNLIGLDELESRRRAENVAPEVTPEVAAAILEAREPKINLVGGDILDPEARRRADQRGRIRALTNESLAKAREDQQAGVFDPSIIDWLTADFSHFGNQAWSGFQQGTSSFWRMIDNVSDFVSDVAGLDRNDFEDFILNGAVRGRELAYPS